jgi:hypothetical protein
VAEELPFFFRNSFALKWNDGIRLVQPFPPHHIMIKIILAQKKTTNFMTAKFRL